MMYGSFDKKGKEVLGFVLFPSLYRLRILMRALSIDFRSPPSIMLVTRDVYVVYQSEITKVFFKKSPFLQGKHKIFWGLVPHKSEPLIGENWHSL